MSRHTALQSARLLATAAVVLIATTAPALAEIPHPEAAANGSVEARPLAAVVDVAIEFGIAVLVLGTVFCLYRILRGPHLADRVLATDALALHVVGLVVALAIYLRTTLFFDVALIVAIIGFASTLAFAQYIAAEGNGKPESDTAPPEAPANPNGGEA